MSDMAVVDGEGLARIKPFSYADEVTGNTIEMRVSDYYFVLQVNGRAYYFVRETGAFDGVSRPAIDQ